MPEVDRPAPITSVLGQAREGVSRHLFLGANFFVQRMLNRYRDELATEALPGELEAAAFRTVQHLQSEAARISVSVPEVRGDRLEFEVAIENLGGHKLPTAYPSRRVWLHAAVRDRNGRMLFESGALEPNGSIVGNDNDLDAGRYEPHYAEIRSRDQVQIYEDIMGDVNGTPTTGLLKGVRFLKDNRILPRGFDKMTANKDIAVVGAAFEDPDFTGGSDRVRYSALLGEAQGPYRVSVELLYQPISFRWASNLRAYAAFEPQRFVRYYDEMAEASAVPLARADTSR
jgi:hypothetical protein